MEPIKKLKFCEEGNHKVIALWKAKGKTQKSACKTCWQRSQANTPKENKSPVRSAIKPKTRRPTGEYALFLQIYAERKGKCEITGEQIPFDVKNFSHCLGKGAYPSLRLDPNNIFHVKPEIHDLYDNSSKEKLLGKYPGAIVIYERKDKLRYNYYNK